MSNETAQTPPERIVKTAARNAAKHTNAAAEAIRTLSESISNGHSLTAIEAAKLHDDAQHLADAAAAADQACESILKVAEKEFTKAAKAIRKTQ